jgi:molybdopterin-guanine dinucleotide biosynthesis protein A
VAGRAVVLLLTGPRAVGGCPPGVSAPDFAQALAEDLADLLAGLAEVEPMVAAAPDRRADAAAVVWPGMPVLPLAAGTGPVAVLAEAAAHGYATAAVVAPDAPDLPGMLIAKAFSGLTGAPVAAVPAAGGGLVALASRLPPPRWLDIDLDAPDAIERLRRAAPRRRDVVVTPGWHRLRTPGDIAALDPGLEGWEATRALLAGGPAR